MAGNADGRDGRLGSPLLPFRRSTWPQPMFGLRSAPPASLPASDARSSALRRRVGEGREAVVLTSRSELSN